MPLLRCRLPLFGLLVPLWRVLERFRAFLLGLLALVFGVELALLFEPLALLRLPLEPVLFGLPLGVVGLRLRFEGFGLLPLGVFGGGGRQAMPDFGAVEVGYRAGGVLASGVAQGAVDLVPFGVQPVAFRGDRAGFLAVLVAVEPFLGGLAGAAFVAGGGGAEVAAGFVREASLGVAAGVEPGSVAGALQGLVRQLRPARPRPLGQVLQPVALAVDRVEFDRFAAEFAFGGDVAGRQQDVGVPVAVVSPERRVGVVVLLGVAGQFGVADRPGGV